MKNLHFMKKACLVFVLCSVSTAPTYPTTAYEWIYNNKTAILAGTAVAALLVTVNVMIPKVMKRWIEEDITAMREQARALVTATSTDMFETVDSATQDKIAQQKEALTSAYKNMIQKGVNVAAVTTMQGNMDVAHVVSFVHQRFSGKGIITSCISRAATEFDGNFIVRTCEFMGNMTLKPATTLVSFNQCLIEEISAQGKDVVIELLDTLVINDIVFEHNGIVVIDDKSVFGGKVVNGTVVRMGA